MAILGVSFDTIQENADFAAKNQYPYPLLCDTERKIGLAYGACDSGDAQYARRITYVIGPDGKIAKAFEKVDARQHPAELAAQI